MQFRQRLHLLGAALAATTMGFTATAVHAQAASYPGTKPIRIVVPFPAGGPTDIAARVVGQAMGQDLKASVIIENKGGAHGFIGAGEAAKSAPDGYTLMMASIGTMAINPGLYKKMPYDPNKDFEPLSLVLTVPIVLVANPQKIKANTVPELVDYLKAHPSMVNYASAGAGGSSHLVPEYFKFRTQTQMTHIPYKGSGPAVSDLVAGQVDLMFDTLLTSTTFLNAGKLKMLAVTTRERLPQYPNVPTMSEALGIQDFEASSWYAMYAPAGTPKDITKQLSESINRVLKDPAVLTRIAELGAQPAGGTPEDLAAFQRSEQNKWGQVIQAANITPH